MFDIAPSEFLLVAVVALVVIGPKDLPKALRVMGYWVGRARGVARQFRAGFDNMVREAELAEMEKKWAEENKRIMAEHGAGGGAEASASAPLATAAGEGAPAPSSDAVAASHADPAAPASLSTSQHDLFPPPPADEHPAPVMVERPRVEPAPAPAGAPAHRPDDALS
jgi:sec-independent protein translocase protein TatB